MLGKSYKPWPNMHNPETAWGWERDKIAYEELALFIHLFLYIPEIGLPLELTVLSLEMRSTQALPLNGEIFFSLLYFLAIPLSFLSVLF